VVPRARIGLATPAFSGPRSTGELPRHRWVEQFYGNSRGVTNENSLLAGAISPRASARDATQPRIRDGVRTTEIAVRARVLRSAFVAQAQRAFGPRDIPVTAKFSADFAVNAHRFETEALVQRGGSGVGQSVAGHEAVDVFVREGPK
jgi:hypothetical protein